MPRRTFPPGLMPSPFSRRALLRAGGAAALAPLLPGAFERRARAQEARPGPKRLVIVHAPQGTVMEQYVPLGDPSAWDLSFILEPLAGFRDRLVIATGVDNRVPELNTVGNAHQNADFTHYAARPFPIQDSAAITCGGPTIEQVIAGRIAGDTPFGRLDFGVGGASSAGFATSPRFFAGMADPVTPFNDPEVALNRIFGDGTLSEADLWAQRARRGAALDAVIDSFGGLRRELDADGRERLDAHLDKVRSLEARVRAGVGACSRPAFSLPGGYSSVDDDDVTAPILNDILATALSCDYARVATLDFFNGHDHAFPWLWADNGGMIVETSLWDNWHAMVHADFQPGMEWVYRWYLEMLADLLTRMDGMLDADGENLLDTSLVLFMSEFSSGRHWNTSLPTLLFGDVGAGGRWLNFLTMDAATFQDRGGYEYSGVTTNQLFTSILHRFGGDDETFGQPLDGTPLGPLPGLFG